jgi:hypothetical protein
MTFKPKFLSTGVGSMPFKNIEKSIDISLLKVDVPFWPQMPKLDLNEQMEIQYSEGMPCIVIDREKGRMYFDTTGDYSEKFAEFYEGYIMAMDPGEGTGDCSSMAISSDYSKGIYALKNRLTSRSDKLPYIKVQTTGPCSFALTIVDENKRAIYYNEEFRDVIIKTLAMKCRWQIQQFQEFADKVICFVDEPILSGFGSSTYVSVKREEVVSHLKEVIDAIHTDNGIAGIHCCGNTEWSILIDAGVDIVNFDAYEYGETIAYYSEHVKTHLDSGEMLAWGVVPTSTAIREQDVDTLETHFENLMDNLADKGIDKQLIMDQAIITPSCGTGSMEPDDAEKVFEMIDLLTRRMKEKYNL